MTTVQNLTAGKTALLSDNALEAYRRDGAALLPGFFTDWLPLLEAGVARNLAEPSPLATDHRVGAGGGRFFEDYCSWQRLEEYRRFIEESPAAALAGQLMGAKAVQIFHEHLLIKEPGTTKTTPWHHDLPYYCVGGDQVVSLWTALDPVPARVCPRFLAGSHRWGKLYYPRRFDDGVNYDFVGDGYETVPEIDEEAETILSWDLQPGDSIAFHFLTLHAAPGNAAATRRRGFSTRWLGDDAHFVQRPGKTSPPFPDIGLEKGERLREDWFPVVWRAGS
ncbi:MAG: phytanoyl-CoA dioxygenase family protein [Pseudomonadota bacterium]